MKTHLFSIVSALALFVACVTAARAGTIWVIPPESPNYLINSSASGVDVLEAFIETPLGATFDNLGFANFNAGWGAFIINPTYAVEFGPLSTSLAESLDIIGIPHTVNVYAFTGCSATPTSCSVGNLTDAYQVTFNDGGYVGWTALTAGDWALENTTDPNELPEPASMLLIGSGLIGLTFRRYQKR